MVPIPNDESSLVYDLRLSSVVPSSITGENKIHELTNMDLIVRLHYIKAVYFFNEEAARGLTKNDFKKAMSPSLVHYYPIAGRIRTSEENGRPYIKCNDSGVRIVEAKCNKTIEQWLESKDSSLSDEHLTYSQVLGPDLGFSPLVFVQFTWFQCGGISIGLSWAHVVGDAFSASHFINTWGQFLNCQLPPHHFDIMPTSIPNKVSKTCKGSSISKVPSSLQRVQLGSFGDQWLISKCGKMQSHSFHITVKQFHHLNQVSKLAKNKPFEVISAMIWKSLAKVRGKLSEPKNVTICARNISAADYHHLGKENNNVEVSIGNSRLTIWTVAAAKIKGSIAEADLTELANLIDQEKVDETRRVDEVMDDVDGNTSEDGFILYGANLTFVNLEGLKIYGLELREHKPVFANCYLSGAGDEGTVLVLPGPGEGEYDDGAGKMKEERGRMVNLILPENQLEGLKKELQNDWNIC